MNETTAHEMSILEQLTLPKFFLSDCFILPDPLYDKVMDRHSSNLTTAVIDRLCSPFVVIANSLVVLVITRSPDAFKRSLSLPGVFGFFSWSLGAALLFCLSSH